MSPLWFLEALGLSALADETAVRRAYATLLRAIDPAADPAAFARLREAYEEARAWCVREEPSRPVPTDDDAPGVPVAMSPDTAAVAVPPDEARQLTDAFVEAMQRCDAVDVAPLLASTVAGLRMQYIDAPGQFEEQLIDLLRARALPHRSALFDAATDLFHWDEIGHLTPLGERGAWVERVGMEKLAWLRLAESRQTSWLRLFHDADRELRDEHVRQWPAVAPLLVSYPAWLSLHARSPTLREWQARFEALEPFEQENAVRSAPRSGAYLPARLKPAGTRHTPWTAFLTVAACLVFALVIVRTILSILAVASAR